MYFFLFCYLCFWSHVKCRQDIGDMKGEMGELREVFNWGGKTDLKEGGNESKTTLMFERALKKSSYI